MENRKLFAVSMAVLWSITYSYAMHSIPLGICMGIIIGIAFSVGSEDEKEKK